MSKFVTDLPVYTTPLDADVFLIVDIANNVSKQVTFSTLKTTLNTYFSGIYVTPTSTSTLTNKTLSTGTKVTLGSDAVGDVYYQGASNNLTRLAIGSASQVLTVSGGLPSWQTPATVAFASNTVAGLVELATAAEINAGTSTGGSGAALVVTPDQLLTSNYKASLGNGGTGADGALTVSSGTTNIDCAGAALVEKNYTSIAITGTGKVTFSNPHANGTIVILKSQSGVDLTSSQTPMLDMSNMGAAGGVAVTAAAATNGNGGSSSLGTILSAGGGGGAVAGTSVGVAGAVTSLSFNAVQFSQTRNKYVLLVAGSGGGGGCLEGGGGAPTTGATGGRGGGALLIECAGAWNFTTASGISVAGQSPAAGTDNGTNQTASAGAGGGSGGMFVALYNTLTANSGTVTVTGGTGGNNGAGSYAPARKGSGGGGFLVAGTAGTSTAGASAKSGGDGATGYSVVAKNTNYS